MGRVRKTFASAHASVASTVWSASLLHALKWSPRTGALSRRPRTLPVREAIGLIVRERLQPACGAWHFSWDIERFCETMIVEENDGRVDVYAPRALNEWSPFAHFTSSAEAVALRTAKTEPLPFWLLRLTTFDGYLQRCSSVSARPRDHFPSRETYSGAAALLNCRLEHMTLQGNEARFARWYDTLKDPRYHHSGDACWRGAIENHPRVPYSWFTVSALIHNADGACKAVQLAVSDGRSHSGVNIAAMRRSRYGYGVMLAVEEIKRLCAMGATSFDCGVSGVYGDYKKKIFLDALTTTVVREQ
ncbi:hypothetical protein [Hyphomicrobium sp. D-2]|uniref:hypothetical protein n=1 Tax=Hyphomicrobium sp. D-2 TaxID=3041621 RepID=UPI00245772F2|nr:hypothetical protein [Hyphomicrobium sp. D-2]MDH4981178.1 hypothetical protein [Hyphomicrobium sp. D-2]